jgi:glycosyltransferase involved in cell wall biosynthesis
MLTAKLLGKRIFWLLPSSHNKMIKHSYADPATSLLSYLQTIGYHLANGLILDSPNLIQEWKLEKYRHKIHIAAEHIIDIEAFSLVKGLDQRPNLVGYIGRLSEEKGICCLMKAIPQIVKAKPEIEFFIGGDGILYDKIERLILNSDLDGKTTMIGWIPHESLSHYLNELRLLIIPSYTEGLPNIMLEAMACGTPVLATPIGAVPDVIVDGKTGFIMENISPECIAENVMRALGHLDLGGIALRARILVENEFTFERAVERWKQILEDVCDDRQ